MMNFTDEELMAMWRDGNNRGNGFAVGGAHDTPEYAAISEGYYDVHEIDPEGSVVALDGYKLIVICNSNGPWAVRVA